MDLACAEKSFVQLLEQVKPKCVAEFLDWIQESFTTKMPDNLNQNAEGEACISGIIDDIRCTVPVDAMLPSECTVYPSVGVGSDCIPQTTAHIDAFLYDDDDVDNLVQQNLLSRHYCKNCGSRDCSPLTFISHSMSVAQMRYIFSAGPREGLISMQMTQDKVLLDVGSRLGAVLYAAYHFAPNLSQIIGVEINGELCKLQNDIINKHKMGDKINIIQGDICEQIHIINAADIITLHNTFQFFISPEHQINCWKILRSNCLPGCILVTLPSIEELTNHIQGELGFSIGDWLIPAQAQTTAALYAGTDEDLFESIACICMYQVK